HERARPEAQRLDLEHLGAEVEGAGGSVEKDALRAQGPEVGDHLPCRVRAPTAAEAARVRLHVDPYRLDPQLQEHHERVPRALRWIRRVDAVLWRRAAEDLEGHGDGHGSPVARQM